MPRDFCLSEFLPWFCCLRHMATPAGNGGTLKQLCPEESVGLLPAAPSWDYMTPPSLMLKFRGRGGDPASSAKVTTKTPWAPGQQVTFSFSKEAQSLFKSKRNKDVGELPPPCDKRMGRKNVGSR